MYSQYLRIKIFQNDSSSFFKILYWKIERTRQMVDQEDIINLGKFIFDDNNQERKS